MATKPDPYQPLKDIAEAHYRKKHGPKHKSTPKVKPPEDLLPDVSNEDLNKVYDEVLIDRELGIRSLRDYARICWPKIEPGIPYVENAWHSDCLSDHFQAVVEGKITRLLISIPPGFGKSTWSAILFPGFSWLHHPYWKLLYGSYMYELSMKHSIKFIRLTKSKFWQKRWGHLFDLEDITKSKVSNSEGGSCSILSVTGKTLGYRADVAIADDPLNITQVKSEIKRTTVKHWWMNGIMSRGNVNLRGVVICQRLHDDDLVGHLLDLGGWEYLCLPFEYVPKRRCVTYTVNGEIFFEDPREQEGEILFPELFPVEYLRERMKDPETASSAPAMYQQDPVPEGGNIIKTSWFRFYKETPEEIFDKCSVAYLSADTAIKEKSTSSYTVIQIWARQGTKIYLIDQLRMRLSFTAILEAFTTMLNKWNNQKGPHISAKLVEDKASGPDIIDTLQDKIAGLIPSEGNDDKEDRMHAITWLWEGSNIYVPGRPIEAEGSSDHKIDFSYTPWMQDWYDEITRYPVGKYTDQAMAMSQALMYIGKQMKTAVGMPSLVSGGKGYMYNYQQQQAMDRFRRVR